jgi:hypothetical protein
MVYRYLVSLLALTVSQVHAGGSGPQSPRDIDSPQGNHPVIFAPAPPVAQLNLCNIHLHTNAEHKGGEFTTPAGEGNAEGIGGGFRYAGTLSVSELTPYVGEVCGKGDEGLKVGDTLEMHYVYSSADVQPGPTLGACMNDAIKNPQLRVEAVVMVMTNDKGGADMAQLAQFRPSLGKFQAVNLPTNLGKPIEYAGSTTGPAYNAVESPFQVWWSVRPRVLKVSIASMAAWCRDNPFQEAHVHGVRTLVTDPGRLSSIAR